MRWFALLLLATCCHAQETRDAAALLADVVEVARSAKGWLLAGTLTVVNGPGGDPAGDFKLAWSAPELVRYESGGPGSSHMLLICDGTSISTYLPEAHHYMTQPIAAGADSNGDSPRACNRFLPDWRDLTRSLESAVFLGEDALEWNGGIRPCDIVRAEYAADDALNLGHRTRILCVDREHHWVIRERLDTEYPATAASAAVHRVQTTTYREIQRDPVFPPGVFSFQPPEGVAPAAVTEPYRPAAAVTAPILLERHDPEYPKKAVKAGIEGTVVLRIEIGPDGRAHNVQVARSLDPELDQKAIECVQTWKFRPGTKNGSPVTVAASVEVAFRLVEK
jgi:TonB family protein